MWPLHSPAPTFIVSLPYPYIRHSPRQLKTKIEERKWTRWGQKNLSNSHQHSLTPPHPHGSRYFLKLNLFYPLSKNPPPLHWKPSIFACNVDNFWSAQDIKIAPSGNVNWSPPNMFAKCFQLFQTMCHQSPHKESTPFTTKTRFSMLFDRILATLLAGIPRWWFPR